jgi:hypothetical protein
LLLKKTFSCIFTPFSETVLLGLVSFYFETTKLNTIGLNQFSKIEKTFSEYLRRNCDIFGFIVTGGLFFIFGSLFTSITKADISGPPPSRTGAPGETTCTSCHNQNAGSGQFSIVAPANYSPGQTYMIQVRHTTADATRRSWGFELTALANNVMAGSFANPTTLTRIRTGNGRFYIMQTAAGTFQGQTNEVIWSYSWTAPATNVGPVIFYAAGLQANDNESESGDQTYTANVTVQPTPVVASTHTASDFDGDGKTDPAVLRNNNNNAVWYARTPSSVIIQQFGLMSDKFAPADFDGDGKTDAAIYRSGTWYIRMSSTTALSVQSFGAGADTAVPRLYFNRQIISQ